MKSIFISFAVLFLSSLGTASVATNPTQYIVNTGIYIDGKLISNPRIAVLEGEESVVSQHSDDNDDRVVIKITAKNAKISGKPSAIMVSLDLFYKKGAKEVRSSPQVIVMEGMTGMIEVVEKSGPTVSMEVSAKKLN